MMPMHMTVTARREREQPKTYNVQIARQKSLLANLVFTALTNSVDMEGDLPDELTAELTVRIEIEGQPTLVLKDTYSGYGLSGTGPVTGRCTPCQVGLLVVNLLTQNPYKPPYSRSAPHRMRYHHSARAGHAAKRTSTQRSNSIPIRIRRAIRSRRTFSSSRIRAARRAGLQDADAETAGRPAGRQFHAAMTICDDIQNTRSLLRENPKPHRSDDAGPTDGSGQFPANRREAATSLVLKRAASRPARERRVDRRQAACRTCRRAWSRSSATAKTHRGPAGRRFAGSVASRSEWVVQGGEIIKFTVTKNNKIQRDDNE